MFAFSLYVKENNVKLAAIGERYVVLWMYIGVSSLRQNESNVRVATSV